MTALAPPSDWKVLIARMLIISSVVGLFALGATGILFNTLGPEEWHYWFLQNFGWAAESTFLSCAAFLAVEYFWLKRENRESSRMFWFGAPVLLMFQGVSQLVLALCVVETFGNPYLVVRWEGALVLWLWGAGLVCCKRFGFRDDDFPAPPFAEADSATPARASGG